MDTKDIAIEEEFEKLWGDNDDPDAPMPSIYSFARYCFLAGVAVQKKNDIAIARKACKGSRIAGKIYIDSHIADQIREAIEKG